MNIRRPRWPYLFIASYITQVLRRPSLPVHILSHIIHLIHMFLTVPNTFPHQIPGTIAKLFFLYFPPSSFLYLLSFFFAQMAI